MDFLWTDRRSKFIFGGGAPMAGDSAPVDPFSSVVSLDRLCAPDTMRSVPGNPFPAFIQDRVRAAVHRFEQSIAGRLYLIEVARVPGDRWRAYIVRLPGVPTALMPFYGATPDEAAQQLGDWLTRAYDRAAGPKPAV